MTDTSNAVLTAISDITGKIGSIEKRGKNSFHNYNYATAADILHKLQPMLAEHGLIIMPTQTNARFLDDAQALFAIDYEFSLYHKSGAVHPEKPILTGMAAARNSKGGFDDKIANKCLTAATKYFLLTLFKIPTGDYDDADADDDRPVNAANAAPRKSSYRSRKDGDFDGVQNEINACTTVAELEGWREKNSAKLAKMSMQYVLTMNEEIYEPRMADLKLRGGAPGALTPVGSAEVRAKLISALYSAYTTAAVTAWRNANVAVFKEMTKADQKAVADERDARLAELFEKEQGEKVDSDGVLMAGE